MDSAFRPFRNIEKIHREKMMSRIAVTSEGPTLKDMVDPRFGRAGGFVLVDPETMEHEYVDNGQSQAMGHGAGIQAAQVIADSGAKVVLTGYVGPKAFEALRAAGINIVQNLDNMSVQEAVEKYKSGSVDYASQSNK
jgi:predicted Fe-Mo cluster-binding NifX family protein